MISISETQRQRMIQEMINNSSSEKTHQIRFEMLYKGKYKFLHKLYSLLSLLTQIGILGCIIGLIISTHMPVELHKELAPTAGILFTISIMLGCLGIITFISSIIVSLIANWKLDIFTSFDHVFKKRIEENRMLKV